MSEINSRISQLLKYCVGFSWGNVSGLHAYRQAGQISEQEFVTLNELAFKLENGLLKLVESLERKKLDGDWVDSLFVKESNEVYENSRTTKM